MQFAYICLLNKHYNATKSLILNAIHLTIYLHESYYILHNICCFLKQQILVELYSDHTFPLTTAHTLRTQHKPIHYNSCIWDHSRFRGPVNCGAPLMNNTFQIAKFSFEVRKSSSLFCTVQNGPGVTCVPHLCLMKCSKWSFGSICLFPWLKESSLVPAWFLTAQFLQKP